ncbi:type II toxin-antitoxin system HipA family toxin [Oceanisphaera sp. IT1-181]|uniref:type II toxin-antitoxin system HipA family toxin n=1 Tax=Oceanisphaera sp. IT1-181 TaxID=3081199 RepID=UPI0029CA0085|nr:type II toxin-antitoxin system HipA family toxin [Oceanisphaera sp. IT1-181]
MAVNDNPLSVWIAGQAAGELFSEQGEFVFRYEPDIAIQNFVSLTMPVRSRDYSHSALPPLFEMHLPEGYLLSVLQRHFAKLSGADDLSLLKLLAPSVRGRVHYQVDAEAVQPLELTDLLSPTAGLFDELVVRFALHSPVSGVQPKVLAQIQDKATLRMEDYIVKAWGPDYPQLALNEYWCMRVLKAAGITVPEFYLSDDSALFIIKRFDLTSAGQWLGFEDMCVLAAKSRKQKYEGSYEQLAKSITNFVSPQHKVAALQQFFKMMVLNNHLQNGDAHLKNFGLLYENIHNIWLAPAFDVVSTTAYIKNDVSALTLMGSRKWWSRKNLLTFGVQHCELTQAQANALYDECEQAMGLVAAQIQQALTTEVMADKQQILMHLLSCLAPK